MKSNQPPKTKYSQHLLGNDAAMWIVIKVNGSTKGQVLYRNESQKAAKWFAKGFNRRCKDDGRECRAVLVSLTPGQANLRQSSQLY